jgi:uncharacterized membrane protein YbhN (UPF0104 family)
MLAYVASIAAAPRSAAELWDIIQQCWIVILALTIPYLVARALVWHELLLQVGIRIPWRQLIVAFSGGELTKSLPAGVYTQNYLLARLEHFNRLSLVRSGTATTAMLGLETFVAVPAALVIGIPGSPWLFWIIIGVIVAWLVVMAIAWMLVHYLAVHTDPSKHPVLRRGARLAKEFFEAGADLVGRRTLLSLIPTAIYMLIYVVDLFVILRAAGAQHITFVETLGVYAVIVLAVVLVPIPTELGITEFTGFGALQAYGVPGSMAAVSMLGLRLLATGMTIVVAGLLLLLMRGQLKQAIAATPEGLRDDKAAS